MRSQGKMKGGARRELGKKKKRKEKEKKERKEKPLIELIER
jgi:hypothetical protein